MSQNQPTKTPADHYSPPGPFKITNGIAGYIVAGPKGELHATSIGWHAAELDCARLNGAYQMGKRDGLSDELADAIAAVAALGTGNSGPDETAVSVSLGELRRLAAAAGLPATPARAAGKGRARR